MIPFRYLIILLTFFQSSIDDSFDYLVSLLTTKIMKDFVHITKYKKLLMVPIKSFISKLILIIQNTQL